MKTMRYLVRDGDSHIVDAPEAQPLDRVLHRPACGWKHIDTSGVVESGCPLAPADGE